MFQENQYLKNNKRSNAIKFFNINNFPMRSIYSTLVLTLKLKQKHNRYRYPILRKEKYPERVRSSKLRGKLNYIVAGDPSLVVHQSNIMYLKYKNPG